MVFDQLVLVLLSLESLLLLCIARDAVGTFKLSLGSLVSHYLPGLVNQVHVFLFSLLRLAFLTVDIVDEIFELLSFIADPVTGMIFFEIQALVSIGITWERDIVQVVVFQ